MAQHDYVIANGTGAAVRSDLNNALAAIVSQNSGATEPATTYAFQFWADTTTGLLKLRNSSNNAWVTLFQLDGEWSTLPVENGTAAAPSIYFKDSGTDTGFYSPGTDQVAISTGGTGRLFIDSSGRCGIGTSSPGYLLDIKATATPTIRIQETTNGPEGRFLASASDVQIGTFGGSPLSFYTNSAERMRLDTSGRLGIGTTSPQALTELSSASAEQKLWLSKADSGTANQHGMWLQFANYGPAATARTGDTIIGKIHFYASQPTSGNLQDAAAIECRADGNQSGGQTPSYLVFKTTATNAVLERARIDSSGRLLVGTSTARGDFFNTSNRGPSLQVEGTTTNTSGISVTSNQNNDNGPEFNFGKSRGTNTGSSTIVSSGDGLGRISFQGTDGSELVPAAYIEATVDGTPGTNDMPGRLVFSTTADGASSPTERMRITQAGYLLHGCTSVPSNTVKGFSISPDLVSIDHHRSSSGNQTSNMTHIGFYNGNGIVGSITTNGSATAYGTSSDYRLKENVEPLQDSIVRFQQLKPSRFNFIADPSVVVDGFIAHEVQEIVPEAISGEKDAVDENGSPIYQSIDQSKLVPLLTAALQEAIGEIESLKARLTAAGI